jgi:hypothetical protein
MFLGAWNIDDYLTFPANTHAAATGAATDADAVPSYRVYEDETGTAILTGSMAKLDDTNTTGFYSERIQLTAANGFEVGKTYTIYISAAVSSVTGTNSHTFKVEAAGVDVLTVGGVSATAIPELTGVPSATPSLLVAVMAPFMTWRNKLVSNSTTGETEIYNSAGTKILEKPFTDATSIFTSDKVETPD